MKSLLKKLGFTTSVLLILTFDAYASASGHGEAGIPWKLITAQTVNFTLFVLFLIYILRKPVKDFFKNFRDNYLEESTKAQKVVAAAEKHKKEIEDQLKKLETTYTSKLETAKKEAFALRESIVKESQQRAVKLIADTTESAALLFKNAEQNIKDQVLIMAIDNAKSELAKKVDQKESQRLHGEFLEEITVGSL